MDSNQTVSVVNPFIDANMTYTNIPLVTSQISDDDMIYVNRLRRLLQDESELNLITEVQESTDMQLFESLQDAMDEISWTPPILLDTGYTNFNQIPWGILRLGAVINVLTFKGVLSARNTLTYRDSGGVTVQDMDKYGRYLTYFNQISGRFEQMKHGWKLNRNIDNAYGEVPSEYSLI